MSELDHNSLSELLSAHLDGELTAEEAAFVDKILDTDADARRLLAEMHSTAEAVSGLPRHAAPESLAENIAAQLERSALIDDVSDAGHEARAGSRSGWSAILSMAAAMVVIATGVLWYTYDPNGQMTEVRTVTTFEPASGVRESVPVESGKEQVESAPDAGRGNRRDGTADIVRGRTATVAKTETWTESFGRDPSAMEDLSASRASSSDSGSKKIAVAAQPRIDESAWLAAATVDQIISVNGRISHLASHQFANEAVRLTIPVNDRAEGGQLAQQLAGALKAAGASNVASSVPDAPLNTLTEQGFFLQGRPGANFDESRAGEEILVYLPVRARDALLEEMGRWPGIDDRAVLNAGPIKIRGFTESQLALAGMERESERIRRRRTSPPNGDATRTGAPAMRKDERRQADRKAPFGLGLEMLAELAEVLTKTTGPAASSAHPTEEVGPPHPAAAMARADKPSAPDRVETAPGDAVGRIGESVADSQVDAVVESAVLVDGHKASDADSLVMKRLKQIEALPETDRPTTATRSFAGTGVADARPSSPDDSSVVVAPHERPTPETYTTLVFSFIPAKSQPQPETATPTDSVSPTLKALKGQPARSKKPPDQVEPIRK